jgi:hypothetical protein
LAGLDKTASERRPFLKEALGRKEIIMVDARDTMSRSNQWQDWLNLLLAVWLFVSPWVLGFAASGGGASVAAWNACIVAVVIAVLSIAALARAEPWEEWVNILAGIWLFISPWVLKFSGNRHALWNALIVGALVIIFAAWDLGAMQQTGGRRA